MRKFDNIHKFIFSLLISAYRGNIHKNSSFDIGFCVHHFRKLAKFYVLKNFRTFFIRDIHFFECWLVRIKDVFFGKCFESSQFSSRGIAVDPWTMCQPGFSKNEYFGTIVGTSSLVFTSLRGYMWDSKNASKAAWSRVWGSRWERASDITFVVKLVSSRAPASLGASASSSWVIDAGLSFLRPSE